MSLHLVVVSVASAAGETASRGAAKCQARGVAASTRRMIAEFMHLHRSRRGLSILRLTIYVLVVVGLAGVGFAAYSSLRPRVVTTNLAEGPVIRAVYATGTISPIREFPIRAKRAGTLDRVLVDKGDRVTAGQPLAVVADPALTYAVDRARAELAEKQARADESQSPVLAEFDAKLRAAQEQLTVARREETRLRQLLEEQSRSTSDLERAIDRVQGYWSTVESLKSQRASKLLELQRDVAFAQSALKTAEWELAEQNAASPVDGVVLDRPISQGTRVAINEVLMRVADVAPGKLVMRAAVDEEDITSVSVGQKVLMTLYAFATEKFEGRVKTIYAEADPNRRTFEVDIEIAQPSDRFQAGMTGELAFVLEEKATAKILPSQAVQAGVVYIVRNGTIEKATPTIGVRAVDRVEVIDGLDADAEVIISAIEPSMVGRSARADHVEPRIAVGLNAANNPAQQAFKGFR